MSAPSDRGKLLGVFGAGELLSSAVVASNLAVSLHELGRRVVLVDLDLSWTSELASSMSLCGPPSLADVMLDPLNLAPEAVLKCLLPHPSGVRLLAAPDISGAPNVTVAHVEKTLHLLTYACDLIVADLGGSMDDRILAAMDMADVVTIISRLDIPALGSVRRLIKRLRLMQLPAERFALLLGAMGSKQVFPTREIEETLGLPVMATVPVDPDLVRLSLDRGTPVVAGWPHSRTSTGMRQAAARVQKDLWPAASRGAAPKGRPDTSPIIPFLRLPLRKPRPSRSSSTRAARGLSPTSKCGVGSDAGRSPGRAWSLHGDPANLQSLRMEVHRRLNERLGTGEVEILCEEPGGSEDTPEGRAKVEEAIACILAELGGIDADREERRSLTEEISREVLGLGHLEEFLRNPEITEIMVNGPSQVYVERHGRLELTDKAFLNEAQLHRIVERIIAPLGRRIDESSPMVDARLPDGSRLNAVIKPIAINGPVVTIRKFAARPFTMRDLIDMGTLSEPMADFLRACVISRKNIVISGGTGSGKTTLLNVLSGFIPGDERIVTIEDSAELQLHQQHVCRLEARPPNTEGKGAVTIRQMVRNALRMRPNRIIVGEVRGEEALDMLQALNTGHHGSLTTAHANSPRDLILRLETMVLLAGIDLPLRAIREQISGAVDVVVHQTRFRDGSRKVMAVVEVGDQGGGVVQLKDVFVYRQEPGLDDQGRVRGSFLSTGALPDCLEDFAVHGVPLPPELFAGVLETSTTLH